MKLITLIATALLAVSCASYQYQPEDARLATTIAVSQFIQYSPDKAVATAEVNSAIAVLSSFTRGVTPTPETFKLELAKRLPSNETKDNLVRDLGAVYQRLYASLPNTPESFDATFEQIKLGLQDAILPF